MQQREADRAERATARQEQAQRRAMQETVNEVVEQDWYKAGLAGAPEPTRGAPIGTGTFGTIYADGYNRASWRAARTLYKLGQRERARTLADGPRAPTASPAEPATESVLLDGAAVRLRGVLASLWAIASNVLTPGAGEECT